MMHSLIIHRCPCKSTTHYTYFFREWNKSFFLKRRSTVCLQLRLWVLLNVFLTIPVEPMPVTLHEPFRRCCTEPRPFSYTSGPSRVRSGWRALGPPRTGWLGRPASHCGDAVAYTTFSNVVVRSRLLKSTTISDGRNIFLVIFFNNRSEMSNN